MAFSKKTHTSIMTHSIITLSIMTHSIMELFKMTNNITLLISIYIVYIRYSA